MKSESSESTARFSRRQFFGLATASLAAAYAWPTVQPEEWSGLAFRARDVTDRLTLAAEQLHRSIHVVVPRIFRDTD